MDIVPEFNTTCYLTITEQASGAVTCVRLHRTGDAERILADFVDTVVGGGQIVTRPYEYEIFDLDERYVGRAWGWKKSET